MRWRGAARLKRFFSEDTRIALKEYDSSVTLDRALGGLQPEWNSLSKAQYIENSLFMSQYLLSSQGDRMAMAHAVEGRFPFLDHRVMEFATRIPPKLRLRGFNEKYILKRAVVDLLPADVLARTKKPYRAPIRDAFLGPAAPDYVRELLSASELRKTGIFDPASVEMLVKKCLRSPTVGEMDGMALVGILSTQLLHKRFVQLSLSGDSAGYASDDTFQIVRVDENAQVREGPGNGAKVA